MILFGRLCDTLDNLNSSFDLMGMIEIASLEDFYDRRIELWFVDLKLITGRQ